MTTPKSAKGEVQAVARYTPDLRGSTREGGYYVVMMPWAEGDYVRHTDYAAALAARDAAEERIRALEALVGTVRGLCNVQPVRNVRDVDVETHSREIVAVFKAAERERDEARKDAERIGREWMRTEREMFQQLDELRDERNKLAAKLSAIDSVTQLARRAVDWT